jgi:uncharacterized OB-fold protein/acyl dehydratase
MTTVETDELWEQLRRFVGRPTGPPFTARDPVNLPMIRHWCDAMGDLNPVYTDPEAAAGSVHGGIVAPPTMMQAWEMKGLRPPPSTGDEEDVHGQLMRTLDSAGYASVVATNCEQEYFRYLRPGDLVTASAVIEDISPKKRTGLGDGYFVTTRRTYRDQDGETVGTMLFRILKFQPAAKATPKANWPRPAVNADSAFFWEGTRAGELRIQRCTACNTLRHPPTPGCADCGSLDSDYLVSAGRGRIYSWVVHHHPPVPPLETPFIVALVELEEGTRVVGNLLDIDPEDVRIDFPVEVCFVAVDDDLVLPQWRARS